MSWLLISTVLLWIGFIGMVLVNIALARQIGVWHPSRTTWLLHAAALNHRGPPDYENA